MTHQPYDDRREPADFSDILAADEIRPSLGRQLRNGLGGLVVLMLTGVVIVLMVLWKSP
jgi:hypothetical protein